MKTLLKFSTSAALGTVALGIFSFSTLPAQAKDPHIAGPNSFVRVLHAVPGGHKVDVYIDGKKELNDVTFSSITKYLRLASGTHSVRVTSNNPTRTLLNWRRTLRNGDFYTLGAYGPTFRIRPLSYNDSAGSVAYGKARITAFHLSPGSPPFDVYGVADKTGTVFRLFHHLSYGQVKAANIPALPMTIRFVSGGQTIKTVTGASPREGRKYDLFALGLPGVNFQINLAPSASQ